MSACTPKLIRLDSTGLAYAGSMLQIQLYVNQHPDVLERSLIAAMGDDSISGITWTSPLAADGYREYRNGAFLERLGLDRYREALAEFWPSKGPCWDALGVAHLAGEPYRYLLVEAKSYPDEADSTMGAKAPSSVDRIGRSLAAASEFHQFDDVPRTWIDGRYQAANRLAHLYFLTQICGLEASLLFLCFTEDPTHPSIKSVPLADWQSANERFWLDLGLAGHPRDTHIAYLPGLERPTLTDE